MGLYTLWPGSVQTMKRPWSVLHRSSGSYHGTNGTGTAPDKTDAEVSQIGRYQDANKPIPKRPNSTGGEQETEIAALRAGVTHRRFWSDLRISGTLERN